MAGFTIFSILGNLAFELNTDIESVVRSGSGLAFVSYPDALAKFPWVPQVWRKVMHLLSGNASSWNMYNYDIWVCAYELR